MHEMDASSNDRETSFETFLLVLISREYSRIGLTHCHIEEECDKYAIHWQISRRYTNARKLTIVHGYQHMDTLSYFTNIWMIMIIFCALHNKVYK